MKSTKYDLNNTENKASVLLKIMLLKGKMKALVILRIGYVYSPPRSCNLTLWD